MFYGVALGSMRPGLVVDGLVGRILRRGCIEKGLYASDFCFIVGVERGWARDEGQWREGGLLHWSPLISVLSIDAVMSQSELTTFV